MNALMKRVASAALATLMVTVPARADQLPTSDLLDFCESKNPSTNSACRYFILGVVEGIAAADGTVKRGNQFVEGKKTIICMPDDVATESMVKEFKATMKGVAQLYPDDLKLPAISSVVAFMSRRYPCQ